MIPILRSITQVAVAFPCPSDGKPQSPNVQGAQHFLHLYGSCSPTDCDWNEVVSTRDSGGLLRAIIDFDFVIEYITVKAVSSDQLRVEIWNDFRDPKRQDFYSVDWFHRPKRRPPVVIYSRTPQHKATPDAFIHDAFIHDTFLSVEAKDRNGIEVECNLPPNPARPGDHIRFSECFFRAIANLGHGIKVDLSSLIEMAEARVHLNGNTGVGLFINDWSAAEIQNSLVQTVGNRGHGISFVDHSEMIVSGTSQISSHRNSGAGLFLKR